MNKKIQTIIRNTRRKAHAIAGAIMEVAEEDLPDAPLSEQIEKAATWSNMGTDGDLTEDHRRQLHALAVRAKRHGN